MRKCTRCKYEESVTVHTIFEQIKFPLLKAFHLMYRLSVAKKGMSTHELARELGLSQFTCWKFKRKVQHAMRSSLDHPLEEKVEVDELSIGGYEEGKPGRSDGKKKKAIIGAEIRGGTVGRLYFEILEDYDSESIREFFDRHVSRTAKVKTDKWAGYIPLKNDYNITQVKSEKGKNFPMLHVQIMNIKSWLRGIHHKVSGFHLQAYFDEFCFKFNRRQWTYSIFHKLVERMMKEKPFPAKCFCLGDLS